MENSNSFIGQLQEIRSTLREALRAAENLQHKFVGPRPAENGSNPKPSSESIGSLLGDVHGLSMQLLKNAANHHEIVGDFGPSDCLAGGASPQPRYA